MKLIISEELKKRVEMASANGSVIASDLMAEFRKGAKDVKAVISKTANYFDSVRVTGSRSEYKSLSIKISVCPKDINNPNFPDRGNPNAPYLKTNREKVNPATFLSYFKNLNSDNYKETEMDYFNQALCVNEKIILTMESSIQAFVHAYSVENYALYGMADSPLHGSCMRYENVVDNVADFYVNFAGAKIITAKGVSGTVYGRAVVWDKTVDYSTGEVCSFVDRVYYNYPFVMNMIHNYAKEKGIQYRKTYNDYSHKDSFSSLANGASQFITVALEVPQVKWHKCGAPYLDTMSYLYCKDGKILLRNTNCGADYIAYCNNTGGYATRNGRICPNCGEIHHLSSVLCPACEDAMIKRIPIGQFLNVKGLKKYQGKEWPVEFFSNGKPKPSFALYLTLERLFG